MAENPKPLVSISCITYNHALYIRECLEGFLMQKTNFPFEILIHDDASTDGTADIIREYQAEYPDLIKPILREKNLYSQGIRCINRFNIERAHGKYIALCEGDDFWTDPNKLQIQFDFMEEHPDYSFCATNFALCDELHKTFTVARPLSYVCENKSQQEVCVDILLQRVLFRTASLFFRRDSYLKVDSLAKRDCPITQCGDYPLEFHLSSEGKVHYFPQPTIAYRVHGSSVSNYCNRGKALQNYLQVGEMVARMAERNGFAHLRAEIIATHNKKIVNRYIAYGMFRHARCFATKHHISCSFAHILQIWCKSQLQRILYQWRRSLIGREKYRKYQQMLNSTRVSHF